MREFIKELVRDRFNVVCMLVLFFVLLLAHAAMIHWGRPPEMIHWAEGMITGIFTGLVAMLTGKPNPPEQK